MKKAKILLYDIETSPNLGYSWQKYEVNIIKFVKERELLSIAYKWLGDSKVTCLTRKGLKSDYALVEKVRELFQEADIIIAHNGDSFDAKILKARMVYHNMPPTKRLTSVDTKKVAKAQFNFNGNGLQDLGEFLKLGSKMKHSGFDVWLGCMANDPKAWKEMIEYNKQDVVLLEKVYKRFLPWITNHPSIGKIVSPHQHSVADCPNCGSSDTTKQGYRGTHSSISRQWRCKSCLSWFLTRLKAA